MFTVSPWIVSLFVALVIGMAGLTLLAVHRAGRSDNEPASTSRRWVALTVVGLALWLGIPLVLASRGILSDFSSFPSPFMRVTLVLLVIILFLTLVSPFGRRLASGLSLFALFGFQAFRVVVEVLLMLFHEAGMTPVQMTLEGRNWDIVTGLLALGLLVFFNKRTVSRMVYVVLNLIGLVLVINVTAVAFLSLPTPLQAFAAENTWVTHAPYILLPAFLVPLAMAGHFLSFRKLAMESATNTVLELSETA